MTLRTTQALIIVTAILPMQYENKNQINLINIID